MDQYFHVIQIGKDNSLVIRELVLHDHMDQRHDRRPKGRMHRNKNRDRDGGDERVKHVNRGNSCCPLLTASDVRVDGAAGECC